MEYSVIQDTIQTKTDPASPRESALLPFLDTVVLACLHVAAFLVPLWFLPITADVIELNKQTVLIILSAVALLAWFGSALIRKSFTLSRSWIHIVVAVFAGGYLLSSLFSQDRYVSLAGNFGQMPFAFATIGALFVLYLVTVNAVKSTARLYDLLLTFLASGFVVGLLGFFQIIDVYPFAWFSPASADKAFNTIGSVNSLGSFMAIVVVLAASLLILGCKNDVCILGRKKRTSQFAAGLVWAALAVGLLVSVFVDLWASWVVILFGTVVMFGVSSARRRSIGRPTSLIVPGILCVLSIAFLIWKTPLSLGLPGEVTPSASHSWQIDMRVLQEHPVLGTGPGTWIYDYAKFRAPSANMSQFWSTRFDRGFSTFFTLVATAGLAGIALWLALILSAIVKSASHLVKEKDDDTWQAYLTVFSGWASIVLLGFLTNFDMAQQFAFWFLLALLAALSAKGSFRWDSAKRPLVMTALSVIFVTLSVSAIAVLWLSGQRLVADAAYSSGIADYRAGRSIDVTIENLQNAVQLNRMNDAYERSLSQAFLLRASQAVQGNDAKKNQIVNDSVTASINAAKQATTLSPASVDNWANLAIIYQAIAPFTRGADEYAIANYQEALKREPNNPVFSNEIGKIYILRADAYRTLLSSSDAKVRTDAESSARIELDNAAQALNDAIQAKPDFAQAHYNLGILYEREGRLKEAIQKLEQVLGVNNKDVGIGFQLAILYYRNGERDKAQYVLEQIERLDPTFANAPWYLSSLYAEEGRLDDAVAQLQKLKLAYPDNTTVAQRLDDLLGQREDKLRPAPQPLPEPIPEGIQSPKPISDLKK